MKRLLALSTVLAIAGCATSPVSLQESRGVAPDRMYAYQAVPSGDYGTVVTIRDSGFQARGCGTYIYIDDTPAAMLGTSERAEFKVRSGEHVLGASPSGRGSCGWGDAKNSLRRNISISVKTGINQYFRIAIGPSGEISLNPTSF